MQYARPDDCRAKISKDFCAYISGSDIRTPSQCKSRYFALDDKNLSLENI